MGRGVGTPSVGASVSTFGADVSQLGSSVSTSGSSVSTIGSLVVSVVCSAAASRGTTDKIAVIRESITEKGFQSIEFDKCLTKARDYKS